MIWLLVDHMEYFIATARSELFVYNNARSLPDQMFCLKDDVVAWRWRVLFTADSPSDMMWVCHIVRDCWIGCRIVGALTPDVWRIFSFFHIGSDLLRSSIQRNIDDCWTVSVYWLISIGLTIVKWPLVAARNVVSLICDICLLIYLFISQLRLESTLHYLTYSTHLLMVQVLIVQTNVYCATDKNSRYCHLDSHVIEHIMRWYTWMSLSQYMRWCLRSDGCFLSLWQNPPLGDKKRRSLPLP
jgi:hypothetical protein